MCKCGVEIARLIGDRPAVNFCTTTFGIVDRIRLAKAVTCIALAGRTKSPSQQ